MISKEEALKIAKHLKHNHSNFYVDMNKIIEYINQEISNKAVSELLEELDCNIFNHNLGDYDTYDSHGYVIDSIYLNKEVFEVYNKLKTKFAQMEDYKTYNQILENKINDLIEGKKALRKQLKAISELLKQTHMSDIDRAKFIAILEEESE